MSIGQPVAAVAPGKVIRSSRGKTNIAGGCDPRYSNNAHYVVIDHGENVSSLYLHLSEVNVSVGDTISQGQIIGKSGNTGWACGAHLHFSFQKTNTIGSYGGESIGFGFIETGKTAPQYRFTYTSQNSYLGNVVQLELRATPPSGVKQCLEVDGTKIGILPNALFAKVGSCRPIQEQQFRVIDDGNGFKRFELKATPPSGVKQCLEVDGTKIGILPNALFAKVGSCRPIQEQQFQIK
jgi:murein DD-endopeptidase MepM/ murein hydrolase activator NlpD